jgi:hypothetical protein
LRRSGGMIPVLKVCGLPGLYGGLCGPRGEAPPAEGTVLHELGYIKSMVVKL